MSWASSDAEPNRRSVLELTPIASAPKRPPRRTVRRRSTAARRRRRPDRCRAVLSELLLGLDPVHTELDPDDAARESIDEAVRRIVDRPRFGHRELVVIGQRPEVSGRPRRIVVDREPAVEVDDLVVPRRDGLAVLGLRRVPRRRDVRVAGRHDDERVARRYPPDRIRSRQVGTQRRQVVVDHERQRGGPDAVLTGDHEVAEAAPTDQSEHARRIVDREVAGQVDAPTVLAGRVQ